MPHHPHRVPSSVTRAACPKGDVKRINDIAVRAPCTGMIIVGGGLVKHHVCNANLMRNGADFAVFMNTGTQEIHSPADFVFPRVCSLLLGITRDGNVC